MIKHGVDLRDLQPQLCIAYTIATEVYRRHGGRCTITSAKDGTHGPRSLHSRDGLCRALDLRTHDLLPAVVLDVHRELTDALGEQFDTILEDDHIHLEWGPKTET